LSHEQLNRLLKEQAENLTNTFKAQIQALQDRIEIRQQPVQPAPRPHPAVERMQTRLEKDLDDYNRRLDEGPWIPVSKTNRKVSKIAERVAQAMVKRRRDMQDQHINKLADKLGNMTIDDSDEDDPINTTNMADGSVILEDEDGNEYTAFTTRSVKKSNE
jgi:hypothetical protein